MIRPKRRHRLDKGIKGWIYNQAVKNYWRVAAWYDLEDLVQEGYMCYAKCNQRYPKGLDKPHFMRLVQVTFTNRIHDMAKAATRQMDSPAALTGRNDDIEDALESLSPSEPEEATFATMLSQLPKELKQLLKILINDAHQLPMKRHVDGSLETRNQYFARLLGTQDCKIDFEAAFRNHFYGESQ